MAKFKILTILGTRPEAIKLAPLVNLLQQQPEMESKLCVTAQHRELLDQMLALFALQPDFDLNIMQPEQDLTELSAKILLELRSVLREFSPNLVIVQGDTTTAFIASLACHYQQIPVAHIEAGLRTHQRYSPFPEEINRRLTSVLAQWHFAPTEKARQNLLAENIAAEQILLTGNTGIDALFWIQKNLEKQTAVLAAKMPFLQPDKKILLVTLHRRENMGENVQQVCQALIKLVQQHNDLQIIFALHPNPQVKTAVQKQLKNQPQICLLEPQPYLEFVYLMQRAFLILTDSGGIQEEAPVLGKPVLLLRNDSERPEAIEQGSTQIIGANSEQIIRAVNQLWQQPLEVRAQNLFGDGNASERIVAFIKGLAKNV